VNRPCANPGTRRAKLFDSSFTLPRHITISGADVPRRNSVSAGVRPLLRKTARSAAPPMTIRPAPVSSRRMAREHR